MDLILIKRFRVDNQVPAVNQLMGYPDCNQTYYLIIEIYTEDNLGHPTTGRNINEDLETVLIFVRYK